MAVFIPLSRNQLSNGVELSLAGCNRKFSGPTEMVAADKAMEALEGLVQRKGYEHLIEYWSRDLESSEVFLRIEYFSIRERVFLALIQLIFLLLALLPITAYLLSWILSQDPAHLGMVGEAGRGDWPVVLVKLHYEQMMLCSLLLIAWYQWFYPWSLRALEASLNSSTVLRSFWKLLFGVWLNAGLSGMKGEEVQIEPDPS